MRRGSEDEREVASLLKALSLAVRVERAMEIREEVGLFQAIKSAITKSIISRFFLASFEIVCLLTVSRGKQAIMKVALKFRQPGNNVL